MNIRIKCCPIIFLFILLSSGSFSQSYYVSNSGDDTNPGTESQPFKTIQKALDTMQAGGTAYINPGIYREELYSKRSGQAGAPITLEALSGGDVILTATDRIENWTVHSGNIYKAVCDSNVYQLFVLDTVFDFETPGLNPTGLMTEARYPNRGTTSKGIFENPEDGNYASLSRSGDQVTFSGIPSGDYTGAKLYSMAAKSSNRWWSGTAEIISNSGSTLNCASGTNNWLSNSGTGYIAGPLQLLDAAKEWSKDGDYLYFLYNDGGSSGGSNMITNGGFESGTTNWTLSNYVSASGSFSVSSSVKYSGSNSAQINISATDGTGWHSQFIAAGSNIVGVSAGTKYELSFWIKSNQVRTDAIDVGISQPDPYEAIASNTKISTTTDWQKVTYEFTPSKNYTEARITLLCGAYAGATYYIDDIDLRIAATPSEDETDPNNLIVEAKTRGHVLRLDHDYIVVDGIKTFGGAIRIDGNNNTITNVESRHLCNSIVWTWKEVNNSFSKTNPYSGIKINGNSNIIKNSEIVYTGGEGISLNGDSNTVENNLIAYTAYYGHFAHGIQMSGHENIIIGNDMKHTAKSHIRIHHGGGNSASRFRILYNDLSYNGYVVHDIGNITAWGADTKGSEIAYNWIHDNMSSSIASGNHGIYLDNNNKSFLIHHNVIWNIRGNTIRVNSPQYNIYIYNNTLGSSQENLGDKIYFNNTLGLNDEMVNVYLKNNFTCKSISFSGYSVGTANNVYNSDCNNMASPAFQTPSSSLVKDKGTILSAVTFESKSYPSANEFVTDGTPDAGAYELGGTVWIPGRGRIEADGLNTNHKIKLPENKVSIYPNPASEEINISSNEEISHVEVYTIQGSLVYHSNNETAINVSKLKPGMYFMKINTASGINTLRFNRE